MTNFLLLGSILLINVPFGYWRANSRKFSWHWILAIHVPVIIAIGLRLLFHDLILILLPAFVAVFMTGQFAGGRIKLQFAKQQRPLSSFLFLDLVRIMRAKQEPHS